MPEAAAFQGSATVPLRRIQHLAKAYRTEDDLLRQELSTVYAGYQPLSAEMLLDKPRLPGQWILGALIWLPTVSVAAGFYIAGFHLLAGAMVGLGLVLHSALQPRVAVFALIVAVQTDWMVTFGGGFISASKVVAVLALAVSLPLLFRNISRNNLDPSMKWILPFVLLPALLIPAAPNPVWALAWVPTLPFVYGMTLLFYAHFTDRRDIRVFVMALIAGALINAAFVLILGSSSGIVESADARVDWGAMVGAGEKRSDMNELARLMCLGVFGAIFLFLTRKAVASRVLWTVLGLILLFGVVFSKARICYIALPFSLLVAPLLLKGVGVGRRLTFVLTILFGAGLVLIVGSETGLLGSGIQERFQSIFEEGARAGHRNRYWREYWNAFLRSGMVGNGFLMTHVTPGYIQGNGFSIVAHNDFLNVLGDMGLLGIILFAGIHIHIFRRIRRMALPWHKAFAISTQIFMLTAGLTQTDYYRRYYGLGLAALIVLVRYDEQVRREAASAAAYYEAAG